MSDQKLRTVGNLIGYLERFMPSDEVRVIIASPKKRVWHKLDDMFLIIGKGVPIIAIEVGDTEPFNDDEIKAAEEDEADEADSVYEHSGDEEVS